MPQVTVYIRNEDLDKWKAIEKKAEFISDALRSDALRGGSPENSTVEEKEALKLCKNGHITNQLTGRCTQKDCKYA